MLVTIPISWNTWTTNMCPFVATYPSSLSLITHHIIENIWRPTMATRLNFPCVDLHNICIWCCRLWKTSEMTTQDRKLNEIACSFQWSLFSSWNWTTPLSRTQPSLQLHTHHNQNRLSVAEPLVTSPPC